MTDPLTTIILAGSGAIASKEVLSKLLGPTAEYFGDGACDLVKKGAENLGRVFKASYDKLKDELKKPGRVNPRVLKNVCDEAPFVEDVFAAEYFGGLLVSARTQDGHDDSAVPLVALVKSLSSAQLRLHFIIYSLVARHEFDAQITETRHFWEGLRLRVPADELLQSLDVNGADGVSQLLLALTGLIDQRLINREYAVGIDDLRSGCREIPVADALVVSPNERGASLFLRALGLRGLHPELITSVNVEHSLSEAVKAALLLPAMASCRHEKPTDPLESLRDELDDKLSDLEGTLDGVKESVNAIKRADDEDKPKTKGKDNK